MASLLDIAPLTKTVSIRGADIEVGGLSTADFAVIMGEYPNLRAVIDGSWKRGESKIDIRALISESPGAVREVIARGVADKRAGHDALLEKASTLSAADQLKIMTGVLQVTMPDGFGPFADDAVYLLLGQWGSPAPKTESDIPIEVSEPSSPPRLSAALVMDDAPKMPVGKPRRANSSLGVN